MLCQLCKMREATVHYTRIVNQQKVEMYVCEQCARENNDLKINIHKLFSAIMGIDEPDFVETPFTPLRCSFCGMTIEEFNKTGLLGCAKCYDVFSDSIQTMLKRIHGNVKHHGKIPGKISGRIRDAYNLRSLKEELQKCIETEDYERAAQIRDKIKALENSLRQNEG